MPRRSVRRARPASQPTLVHYALERLVAGFEPREVLEPLRLPASPKSLEDVVNAFFEGDDYEDVGPVELWNRADNDLVISCGWNGGPGGSSQWSLWAMSLPSRRRVYVESSDWNGNSVLATTPPTFTPEALDIRILQLLSQDNGEVFGTGVIGSIPDEFTIGPRLPKQQLIALVADLLDHSDGDLRERVDCSPKATRSGVVERWLRDHGVLTIRTREANR